MAASVSAQSALLEVGDYALPGGWREPGQASARGLDYARELEAGKILFFATVPWRLPAEDREFLISQKQQESRFHKNISYRPKNDALRGASASSGEESARLHRVMREFSHDVTAFLADFLRPYAGKFQLDFASFRPLEEAGRALPTHRRNDLLHVDSFPTRPMHGARILRIFANINPSQPRVWTTGAAFHEMAPVYAPQAGLERFAAQARSPLFGWRSRAARGLRKLGLLLAGHSAYDLFMLHFHDWLKFNSEYQNLPEHARSEFPPGCAWMVLTDGVPHAALSGQYALEQTVILPRAALVAPELAPVSVLEKLCGTELAASQR